MPKTGPFEKHASEYEDWFEDNKFAYQSEINAIKELMPDFKKGVEVGIGSGKFALPLGIKFGVEPSARMAAIARRRGIEVIKGTGEKLPLENESFDLVLMVTTLCFLDDAKKAFLEVYRVLKKGGVFVNGFVDKNSMIGRKYQQDKNRSVFYREAVFFSVDDVTRLLDETGFKDHQLRQTIFTTLDKVNHIEEVRQGYGQGSFVAIRAAK